MIEARCARCGVECPAWTLDGRDLCRACAKAKDELDEQAAGEIERRRTALQEHDGDG